MAIDPRLLSLRGLRLLAALVGREGVTEEFLEKQRSADQMRRPEILNRPLPDLSSYSFSAPISIPEAPVKEYVAVTDRASVERGVLPAGTPVVELPTTAETILELKRRMAKELYRVELDLQAGARISGKPCDCLSRAKHLGGIESTAEELMSYEKNPIYGQIVEWFNNHAAEFEPAEIAKRPPEYYQGLTPEIRNFRKLVMGTESLASLLSAEDRAKVEAQQ